MPWPGHCICHLHARISLSSCKAVHTGICYFINTLLLRFSFFVITPYSPSSESIFSKEDVATHAHSTHQSSPAQHSRCYFRFWILHLKGVWLCWNIFPQCSVAQWPQPSTYWALTRTVQCSAVHSSAVNSKPSHFCLLIVSTRNFYSAVKSTNTQNQNFLQIVIHTSEDEMVDRMSQRREKCGASVNIARGWCPRQWTSHGNNNQQPLNMSNTSSSCPHI